MSDVVKQWREDANNLNILAFITDRCNYNCWYCYNNGKPKHKDLDLNMLQKYVDFVKHETNRNIDLDLIGGEPTQHPNLIDFCQNNNNAKICIYTNFSKDVRYLQYLEACGVTFDITIHHRNIIDKLQYISPYSIRGITVMLDKSSFDEDIKLFKIASTYFNHVDLQLVFLGNELDDYSTQQMHMYEELTKKDNDLLFNVKFHDGNTASVSHNQLYDLTHQKYHNWYCNAGKDLMYIHNTGDTYRCDGYYNSNMPPEFNIYRGMKIFTNGTICKVENCPFEDNVAKQKVFR